LLYKAIVILGGNTAARQGNHPTRMHSTKASRYGHNDRPEHLLQSDGSKIPHAED
jgi:hypothetical protein